MHARAISADQITQCPGTRASERAGRGGWSRHLDGEVGLKLDLLVPDVINEGGLHVTRQIHVGHHALELRGELRAAPELQLRDHCTLRIVARRPREQQPLRQLLLVELCKDVLVREVGEEPHHLLELVVEGVVREALSRPSR